MERKQLIELKKLEEQKEKIFDRIREINDAEINPISEIKGDGWAVF
jgi:hypothetical protein